MNTDSTRLPADPAQWEPWLLARFDQLQASARDGLARHDWSAMAEVTVALDQLAGQLNLAISQGFSSNIVEERLLTAIDFIDKSRLQARHQEAVMRQKEVDLLNERQQVVAQAASRS